MSNSGAPPPKPRVALHPTQRTLTLQVAPTVDGGHNTIRSAIMPFACFRADDVRFGFDSSIIMPEIVDELTDLADLIKTHTKAGERPPISLFGHADATGSDEYNKALSGRRVKALYGLLVRDIEIWESLFTRPVGGDSWKAAGAVDIMLTQLRFENSDREKRRFQSENGLTVDGVIGPDSRRVLYKKYMDAICPIVLERTDFLGRGADGGGKADFQGCAEFNPLIVMSTEEAATLAKPANQARRDLENAKNRRVLAFLFRPGTRVDLGRWPCPRADEPKDGCIKRFWSDGEKRRTPADAHREFKDTQDTFACRFYHRLSERSPCEGVLQRVAFRYGIPVGDGRWTDDAVFALVQENGVDALVVPVKEGTIVDEYRFFTFNQAKPGIRYRGEMRDDDNADRLFDLVELFRVQDPGDDLGQLPPPPPDPDAPSPADGTGGGGGGPASPLESAVADNALETPVDRRTALA